MENEIENEPEDTLEDFAREKYLEMQDFFEGISHALCAITDAFERIHPGARDIVVDALHDKASWLERHQTPFMKIIMLLQVRDWIASPPPNPATPFEPPSPPACRILKFPDPQQP